MILWSIVAAAMAAAAVLTGLLRRYALSSNQLLDIPNDRSSHVMPTPRGGGVAFVATFLCGLPVLVWLDLLPWAVAIGYGGAGLVVAITGFLDDHGHVAVRWRLLAHFSCAAWLLFWLGGVSTLVVFGFTVPLGWVGSALALFALVWLLNLYNFMDGIDGLAGMEAVSVAVCGALLCAVLANPAAGSASLLLAAAVGGFLLWNFPPAKIFMGDAGSSFLGLILGGMALQAAQLESRMLWAWLIALGVFIVDATWTLMRRLLRGERVYQAHRMHAYQHAARRYGHRRVTLTATAVNVCWLFPLAGAVALGWIDGAAGLMLAYAPLVALAIGFNSGMPEANRA